VVWWSVIVCDYVVVTLCGLLGDCGCGRVLLFESSIGSCGVYLLVLLGYVKFWCGDWFVGVCWGLVCVVWLCVVLVVVLWCVVLVCRRVLWICFFMFY
jgi:hypothetical protein